MRYIAVGAAHEVTGSCHFLELAGRNIVVDFGMEQGKNLFENVPLPVDPRKLDYVFLTHAHVDHSGMLPKLAKDGFEGRIFATRATLDLCEVMLLDSSGIQEQEAEWRSRKSLRRGGKAVEPEYNSDDAEAVLKKFVPCEYGSIVEVCPGIRIRFTDMGHLLGSAAVEIWAEEEGIEKKLVFSGDIGNTAQPLIRDPGRVETADYLWIESTYGDRNHGKRMDYVPALAEVLQRTLDRGGNVVIPSFAVGRTQEMLYFIRQIKAQGLISGHDGFEVFVDSPLALKATGIFNEHTRDCFDEEAEALVSAGINPLYFPDLRLAITADESKAINFDKKPKVIISSSGMCDAGRIRHHLKHNLWREECTILFVGYQSVGTLGRRLADGGAEEVTLFNEKIAVKAEICTLPGVSGHADQQGLLAWARGFKRKPDKVFVIHGENEVTDTFAALLARELGWDTMAPYSGTEYDLLRNVPEKCTEGVPFVKKTAEGKTAEAKPAEEKKDPVYRELLETGDEVMAVLRALKDTDGASLRKMQKELKAFLQNWS